MYDESDAYESSGLGGTGPEASGQEPRAIDDNRRVNEIDRLGDEIAVLSAQIQAATYELLARLREFDKHEGWGRHGAKSCAHWLAWRISLDPGAAREWVRVARALEHLPALSEAMRKGEVSFSKARALTRIATPETDASLVDLARSGTAAHVEKIVRACRRYGPREERDKEKRLHDSRYLSIQKDEDGRYILRARLDPVAGAVFARALDAASEALYEKGKQASDGANEGSEETITSSARETATRDGAADELAPARRRADALVLMAESALTGGLDPGTAGDHYQIVIHVDAPVLADPAEQGISALADGQHVSAETSRRLACDAATVIMTHASNGSILDVGRRTRTVSPALRRALTNRDGGCRFPGCGATRCDAHHVQHWANGGETSLENTLLLCRFHHRLMHEEAFQLKRLPDGEVEFRSPHGLLVPEAPAPPRMAIEPLEALVKQLEDSGIVVDPYTGTPLWDGTRPDLALAVEWFLEKKVSEAKREAATAGNRANGTDTSGVRGLESSESDARTSLGPWPPPFIDETTSRPLDDDEDDDNSCIFEPSPSRCREIDAMATVRRPWVSVLTYEFVTENGQRIPFQEAIFRKEFHLDWNED